jgi:hypothetical protein
MTIRKHPMTQLADAKLMPRNNKGGALQSFINVFSQGCDLADRGDWSLGELMGSVPDLKHDFESHYPDLPYFARLW